MRMLLAFSFKHRDKATLIGKSNFDEEHREGKHGIRVLEENTFWVRHLVTGKNLKQTSMLEARTLKRVNQWWRGQCKNVSRGIPIGFFINFIEFKNGAIYRDINWYGRQVLGVYWQTQLFLLASNSQIECTKNAMLWDKEEMPKATYTMP